MHMEVRKEVGACATHRKNQLKATLYLRITGSMASLPTLLEAALLVVIEQIIYAAMLRNVYARGCEIQDS